MTVTSKKQQFQIFLPGLLKLLAESLYSSKSVAIRELIQNAHDSCVRRQSEFKTRFYKPNVRLSANLAQRTLTITDNGSGLRENEITEYLSTIGRSYTRQLGEDLAILSPEQAEKLIGQFGLGFLSAFLIAEEITLVTRSAEKGSPTLQWYSTGDVHYEVKEVAEHPIGTEITLKVKPEASYLLHESRLRDTIFLYADFINIPIYLENSQTPINTMTPPWESHDPETAIYDYIKRQYRTVAPLAIIPLEDEEIDLGHDTVRVPLRGFLFVPPGTVASVQEYGDLTIYIRRMFICEQQRNLLPDWARFVRGVIDCPYLQPTASREEIQQEENFFHVRQALQKQLIKGLKNIAQTQPDSWRLIVRGHRDIIMGWAVKDKEFFNEVAPIITFHTSQGDLNMPDYLKLTDNTIYYTQREMGSLQEKLLGEGYGMPVVDASRFAEPVFLRQYSETHAQVKLVQMDDDAYQLLRPVNEDEFQTILKYYRERGIRAQVSTFEPEDVPALLIYPPNAELYHNTRKALDDGNVPRPFAGLVGNYIDKMNINQDELGGTLHLNASNTLIQTLLLVDDEVVQGACLELIYHVARLFVGRMLETADVASSFRQTTDAVKRLIGKHHDET